MFASGVRFCWSFHLPLQLQMLLCVAIVISVSPSCVSVTPSRVNSSSLSRQARALAMAVIEVVNSQGFTRDSPLLLSYDDEAVGVRFETAAASCLFFAFKRKIE